MPYSPVYSTPFIQYTPAAPNESFDVPAGYTAVIRQWSCQQDIGGYDFVVLIADSESAPGLVIDYAHGVGAGLIYRQEGRYVVPGGGVIYIEASSIGTAPSFYVGGYLLKNVIS